jgi:hypothetical protein
VIRVMPHASDPERFARIVAQLQTVEPITASEYRGGQAKLIDDIDFPPFG